MALVSPSVKFEVMKEHTHSHTPSGSDSTRLRLFSRAERDRERYFEKRMGTEWMGEKKNGVGRRNRASAGKRNLTMADLPAMTEGGEICNLKMGMTKCSLKNS